MPSPLSRLFGGDSGRADPPPDEPLRLRGHAGIDLRVPSQLSLLEELSTDPYGSLFERLRADGRINPGFDGGGGTGNVIHNGFFPSPDAEL